MASNTFIPSFRSGRPVAGFTLVELLVTLVIAAVLLAVAVPSFASLGTSGGLTSASNAYLSQLRLARSEAIKRKSRVVLCKSADGTSCVSSGGWEQGWILFNDPNDNGVVDVDEAIIDRFSGLPSGYRLTGNLHVKTYVSFSSSGSAKLLSGAFQAGTLTLCKADKPDARQIILSGAGRMRIERTSVESCA